MIEISGETHEEYHRRPMPVNSEIPYSKGVESDFCGPSRRRSPTRPEGRQMRSASIMAVSLVRPLTPRSVPSPARSCRPPPKSSTSVPRRFATGRKEIPTMNTRRHRRSLLRSSLMLLAALTVLAVTLAAQDRLKTMPGYDQYVKMSKEMTGAVKSGALSVTWKDPLTFGTPATARSIGSTSPRRRRPRSARRPSRRPAPACAGKASEAREAHPSEGARSRRPVSGRQAQGLLSRSQPVAERRGRRERGGADHRRQREGPHQIRDGQLGLRRGTGTNDSDVVVAGQHETRLLPLRREAGGRLLPAAGSDEALQPVDTEAYPKAGRPNPIVDLFVYDPVAKKSVKVDVRDGKPFDNTSSATTSTRSPGRRTAPNCCSTGPTAGRTPSNWSRPTPPPARAG